MENLDIKEMSAKIDKLISWLDYEIAHNYEKKRVDKNSCNRIEQNVLSLFKTLNEDIDQTLDQQIKLYNDSQKTLEAAQTLYDNINETLLEHNLGIKEVIAPVIQVTEHEPEEVQVVEENKTEEPIEICETPSKNNLIKFYTPSARDSMIKLTDQVNELLSMKLNLD